MKRNKHSLSHYKLLTCDMGELVPVGCFEVLPGDSIQQSTSLLLRVSPLLAPVMHPVSVRIHHWFVPHRLVWDGWEDFITGGSDGEGGSSGAYPVLTVPGGGYATGSLMDYLGVPPGVAAGAEVSALPARSYQLVFREFYRDEDLVSAPTISTGSGADSTTSLTLQKIAWEKDYLTASRPWPQKGPDVTLPLGTEAPVRGLGVNPSGTYPDTNVNVRESGAATATYANAANSNHTAPNEWYIEEDPDNAGYPNVFADLSAATAVNVNQVREAFALQRYAEARAQYGSRYTEYLRYLGVRSSDARLQRPEYLGGGKQTISFTEILQTGPNAEADPDDQGVGTLRGHGISAMRSRRYRRFFEEHGLVISLLSVRPRTMYVNGLPRMWSRRTKEEYWQKELELIGQQEVLNREVRMQHATPTGVFGYNDRYAEYRHLPSTVAADFRSTLNYWHMARIFGSDPSLNSDFVTCDPTKRINAVQTEDVLWCMASNSIQARRLVGNRTIGRIM